MTNRADHVIRALRTGHDRLATQAGGFGPEDLTRQSGAVKWDVSQVLSHLGSGAEISLATLDNALTGTGNLGIEFNRAVWARWDAMSPAQRCEEFLRADEALVSRWEGVDQPTRQQLRIDLRFLPAPVDAATAAGLRLNEVTLHTWDVEVAFDPAATLPEEAARLLMDQTGLLIGHLGKADQLPRRPVTLAVRTTSPERAFGLAVHDTVALVETPSTPDGILTAPAEWWLRLVAGRHSPAHTPAAVQLSSDKITLDELRLVFPGF